MGSFLKFANIVFISLLLLCCGSCRLGPKYVPPSADIPDAWKEEDPAVQPPPSSATASPALCPWWEIFDDPILNYLEEYAVTYSPDLYAALDKVAQARALAGVERADQYPQLNLNPSYSNMGFLFQLFLPPGLILPTPPKEIFRIHQDQYTVPFNLTYEMDLWGKLAGEYESAVLDAESQAEDFYNSLLTLTTEIASNYFQLRSLVSQIGIYERNIELLRRSLALVKNRFEKGLTSYVDVVTAQQQLYDTEAGYYEILRLRALQENVLATLVGTPASTFRLDVCSLEGVPPTIPPGTPSDILMQRPDLAAAERHAAAQHALIGVAYASFFPSINLTGTLGFASPDIGAMFSWKSRLWAMAANAAQPIFDAGRNMANLDWAYAHFREASHQYQQKVLQAFQEVEDALANLKYQTKEYESYRQSVETAQIRTKLSTNRYKGGLTNFLNVIDSERTQLQAELNLANVLGYRYVSTVFLIKAIGGSWNSFQSAFEEPCRCEQGKECDDGHGPDVAEYNIERHRFQKNAFCYN